MTDKAKQKQAVLDRLNTQSAQCARILARLREGPATTWEVGPALGVLSTTRRIFELRQAGYDIRTSEQWRGRTRIVTYTLEQPAR